MQDLKLKTQLPAITFDYDGLKKWVEGIAAQYTDVVVREEDVAGIKSEMAALNKVKDGLNKARIATKKKVSEPIAAFEVQVKELVEIIDNARNGLDEQVKAHEQAQRDEKRKEVELMIEALKDEHDVPGIDIPFDESWTNKSTAMKNVKAAVEARILEHMRREKERAQLEQARKDRAVAIEQNCKALEGEYGVAMQPSEFLGLQDIDIPLADVTDRMRAAFQKKAEAAPAAARPEPRRATVAPRAATRPAAPAMPTGLKSVTVTLEYLNGQENAVRATLNGLRGMGVTVHVHDAQEAA